jgi:hypothetical protein
VAGRLELNEPGFRGREAGLDVKGDGSMVPYRGAIFKNQLKVRKGDSPYEAIRKALS